jgi:hypothetical protein
MTDDGDQRIWVGDYPVRGIQESIASLEAHPQSHRATREQKVATAYSSAIARVLIEQSQLYLELLATLEGEGTSLPLLRSEALDQARIISELSLSAWHEDVDISEHAFPNQDPIGGLLALELIKSCDVVLTSDDPEEVLLLSADAIDALLHNPFMDTWWATTLPRGEEPPPCFGSGAELPAAPPAEPALATARVILLADCVEASALDYHALVNGDIAAVDESIVRAGALQRAQEITRMLHGNFVLNVDFGVVGEALDPVAAASVLKVIADSCVVFAAPKGDFERYGMTAAELEKALADPQLRAWLDAVEELY